AARRLVGPCPTPPTPASAPASPHARRCCRTRGLLGAGRGRTRLVRGRTPRRVRGVAAETGRSVPTVRRAGHGDHGRAAPGPGPVGGRAARGSTPHRHGGGGSPGSRRAARYRAGRGGPAVTARRRS